MRKIDRDGLLLCELQAESFARSVTDARTSSEIFIRRFMHSNVVKEMDNASILLTNLQPRDILERIDEEYGVSDYGSVKYSTEEMYWIGYIYRYYAYTYDKSSDQTMFRYSDHDPVLVGLRLDNTATYDPKPLVNNLDVMRGNANKLIIRDALTAGGQDSYFGIYDISGRPIVSATRIESSAQAVDLPTAPGVYILYVYFETQVYPYKFIVP